ncbi:hypothetical protein ACFYU9_16850 [Streptomyces sp. NPDC004327]|uniref:hypothetical protein n=1 Tax=Streptomyces sp. NPDC004327 TaxID=3364699 RepID=UPI003691ADB8
MTSAGPSSNETRNEKKKQATEAISAAERELYGGRLRYDQSCVRHQGPLTSLGFGQMVAALPRMMGMVLRTDWKADRRALAGGLTPMPTPQKGRPHVP